MIKRVFSAITALAVFICALSVSAFAEGYTELADVAIFGLRGAAESKGITVPDELQKDYQIAIEGEDEISCTVTEGNSVSVTEGGYVSPNYTQIYWNGGSCSENPTGAAGEVSEKIPLVGTTTVVIDAGAQKYIQKITLYDFSDVYLAYLASQYIKESVPEEDFENMTNLQALELLAQYYSEFSLSETNPTAIEMVVDGRGSEAAHNESIMNYINTTGAKAWERSTAKDADKSSKTGIVALIDGKLYSFTSKIDGSSIEYTVSEKDSLYSYNDFETAAEIYQYDGDPDDFDGVLDIPSEIDGKTVTGIAANAFYKCDGVTEVKLPDTVEYIGDGAFSGLSGLKSINIPKSLNSVGKYVFNGCTSLTDITCPDECESFSAENGVLYNKDKTALLYAPAALDVVIPDTVTEIAGYSFRMNSNIAEITIPSSVVSIGEGAFGDCTALSAVNIENGVKSIDKFAFYRCKNLTMIRLPETVETIGDKALSTNGNLTANCIIGSYAHDYCGGNGISVILSAKRPDAPTVKQIFCNSIALESVDGYEYSMDGENWQQSNVFENLETASDYTFYQRVAKKDDILASEKSEGTSVKTRDESELIYGDANGDGVVNMLDVLMIRKYIAKQPVAVDVTVSDVTDDSAINMLDVLLIRKYIAKQPVTLGPKPAPEPPEIETPDVIETPDIFETPDIIETPDIV